MPDFDRLAWCYDWLPAATHPKRLVPFLRDAPAPLVDIGGGTGRFTLGLAAGRAAIVVDASRNMLHQAQRRRRNVALVEGDARRLPFRDASAGAIVVTEAYHHFAPHDAGVPSELARVLRDDGVVVVEEPDPSRLIGRVLAWQEHRQGWASRFRTPAELRAVFAPCFAEVATHRTGLFTYALVARAPERPQ